MKIEGAQQLFYQLLDQWTDDYKAASELRLKVTEALLMLQIAVPST